MSLMPDDDLGYRALTIKNLALVGMSAAENDTTYEGEKFAMSALLETIARLSARLAEDIEEAEMKLPKKTQQRGK